MKNFKYFGVIFGLFLVFVLAGSAKADLASAKALYLARIDNKQAAVLAQIDRIASLSYINATAQTQLTNNFNSYNTNYLVDLETQINASTTEQEIIDLINSDWQLPYMVLVKSMFNYANANVVAGNIQTGYQLINDTRTFVAGYTTGGEYSLLKNSERQFVLKWDFIKAAYAAGTGWTCRQHDGVSAKVCASQDNLQKQACFWLDEFQKCVGDDQLGAKMAINGDGDAVTCAEISGHNELKDCYENNKCAANGLLEEYTEPIVSNCGNSVIESGEECDWGTAINSKDCSPRYGSDGVARTCDNCDPSDCTVTVLTGVTCGDGIVNGRSVFVEGCDDADSDDATSGDLCYNNCTKRYLDVISTKTALDTALAQIDDYESVGLDSLDVNTSSMDALLTGIYNVYNQAITENEKLTLINGYENSLDTIYGDVQILNTGIVTEVANILAL